MTRVKRSLDTIGMASVHWWFCEKRWKSRVLIETPYDDIPRFVLFLPEVYETEFRPDEAITWNELLSISSMIGGNVG
ncbi:hypothetical protein FOVSG1_014819 [Fusarium oxysporum f. sp. vasinfectum]